MYPNSKSENWQEFVPVLSHFKVTTMLWGTLIGVGADVYIIAILEDTNINKG